MLPFFIITVALLTFVGYIDYKSRKGFREYLKFRKRR